MAQSASFYTKSIILRLIDIWIDLEHMIFLSSFKIIPTTPHQYTEIAENAPQQGGTSTYTIKQWDPPGYGIRVKILKWIEEFLTHQKQKVIIEG